MKHLLFQARAESQTSSGDAAKATERLLATEERWNRELDKLRETYEGQVKELKYFLGEAERGREEKGQALEALQSSLVEKNRLLADLEAKVPRLEAEVKGKGKENNERFDIAVKKAKEFETKYAKLEELYEGDRKKATIDREKAKTESSEAKKKLDDLTTELNKLKSSSEKKVTSWAKEKSDLEAKLRRLESEVKDKEKAVKEKASDLAQEKAGEVEKLRASLDSAEKAHALEISNFQRDLDARQRDIDLTRADHEKASKEAALFKSRVEEQRVQLEETRKARDDSREELQRWQQTWARERSELAHKLRQEEKVQAAEQQALQLKYENRMKAMEESARRTQSQLAQARRERDQHRDNLATSEKRLSDGKAKWEEDEKKLKIKISKMEKKIDQVDKLNSDLDKTKQELDSVNKAAETDRRLSQVQIEELKAKIEQVSLIFHALIPVN